MNSNESLNEIAMRVFSHQLKLIMWLFHLAFKKQIVIR